MRLTNKIRDEIVEKVIKDKIDSKREQFKKLLHDLCYDTIVGFTIREYEISTRTWIMNAPTGALPLITNIRVIIVDDNNNSKSEIYHSNVSARDYWKRYDIYSLEKPVKVLSQDKYKSEFKLKQTSDLGKKFLAVMKKVVKLNEHQSNMSKTVYSALSSCTTHKQLKEHYPDLIKYVPKPVQVAKLPALTNNDVLKCLKGSC